jgi:hypothetical protein
MKDGDWQCREHGVRMVGSSLAKHSLIDCEVMVKRGQIFLFLYRKQPLQYPVKGNENQTVH